MIRNKLVVLLSSALFLLSITVLFIYFMERHHYMILQGGGITFDDPVLSMLPGVDLSVFIFTVTYGSVIAFILLHFRDLIKVSSVMLGYGILLLLRMLSMTLLPLNEPEGLIHLNDPFLNELIYPGNITTDLFFSGHIGIVFLIAFLSSYTRYFVLAGIILAIMLLFQHIHFSIDILAAVPVAFLVAFVVKRLMKKISVGNNS